MKRNIIITGGAGFSGGPLAIILVGVAGGITGGLAIIDSGHGLADDVVLAAILGGVGDGIEEALIGVVHFVVCVGEGSGFVTINHVNFADILAVPFYVDGVF